MIGLRRSLVRFVLGLWSLAAGDQLVHQDQNFRNRTSLFKEQISRGNASLQLTRVRVQDQGRYKCYTLTKIWENKDSFIKLKLDAPVSKIHIEQEGNRITCSSEGIYPEPEITWSTNPPSTFKRTTIVQQTEQQLYNISSSLILSDNVTDVDHSCSISTRRNSRTATLWHISVKNPSSALTQTVPQTSQDFSLIWTFNHSQLILTQTRSDVPYTVTDEWRLHVKTLSESGSLILQGLSSHQEGTYTCELSSKEETIITNSCVKIEEENPSRVTGIVGGAVTAILVKAAAVICLVLYCKKKPADSTVNRREMKQRHRRSMKTSLTLRQTQTPVTAVSLKLDLNSVTAGMEISRMDKKHKSLQLSSSDRGSPEEKSFSSDGEHLLLRLETLWLRDSDCVFCTAPA
ncbi:hypothetical protein Q8A73_020688 [Channa argus]|nr:hypothetical protein Q8A73_020688 [Channa argus]